MGEESPAAPHDPYADIAEEIRREKSVRAGHFASLHLWYGRTSLIESRAAVYRTLVPDDHEERTVATLTKYDLDDAVMIAARLRVLQDHTIRLSKERGRDVSVEQVLDGRVPPPRVLDMFAGGGSIPLEAMRLGAESHALDVSPVAYVIELCGLRYPQLFSQPIDSSGGTGNEGTWAGLADEILFWASWVQDRALVALGALYPNESLSPDNGTDWQRPEAYLWVRTVRCPTVGCATMVPLASHLPLLESQAGVLALVHTDQQGAAPGDYELRHSPATQHATDDRVSDRMRGVATCPACGIKFRPKDIEPLELGSRLIGLVYKDALTGRVEYRVANEEQRRSASQANSLVLAPMAQLREEGLTAPDEPLPNFQRVLQEHGCATWTDLFTARQLLMLLLHARHIAAASQAMLAARIEPERIRAVTAYLGLVLTDLARTHNAFSRWEGRHGSLVTFARNASPIPFTRHYAEASPFAAPYTFVHLAARTVAAVRACAGTGRPARVVCGSALRLPYEDEYFDAIVTDPPYYDLVPYTDLATFDYVWLRRGIGYLFPEAFGILQPRKEEELFVSGEHGERGEDAHRRYLQRTEEALKEAHRVLKADRLVGINLQSRDSDHLQHYLDCAQQVGFSLHRVVPYMPYQPVPGSRTQMQSFFLTLRKDPLVVNLERAIVDAAKVLQLAESSRPSLYDGLAEILLEYLSDEDIQVLIPPDYAGSTRERLGEYVASCEDLEGLLVKQLGSPGMRKVARARGLTVTGQPESVAAALLREVGFHVPLPRATGVVNVIAELRRLVSEVEVALELSPMQMALTSGATKVETLLKQTIWAWSCAVFKDEAAIHLETLLRKDLQAKSLDKLSMGDVVGIFRALPEYIAHSPAAENVQKDFGRPHIYSTRKLGDKLDKLVSVRNKVQHNKEGYLDRNPVATLKVEFAKVLTDAADLLQQLLKDGAIPQLARPMLETRDAYDRITVRLNMEDRTIKEIYPQRRVILGQDYYYLGQRNNPRPVDPVMIPAIAVRDQIL